ncbi:pol protein [Cucumis melo var. makuwa]|uniref:Pol protein n=1 Tax=Cucumis melo var. makuwa TaxID=1194695 RepID=A0A5D3CSU7_CUCMM|nr:pol protein [Cucumis melo var. makuwa]
MLRNRGIPLVKVLWWNHNVEKATWEREDDMRTCYPELFEDESSLRRGECNAPNFEPHDAGSEVACTRPTVRLPAHVKLVSPLPQPAFFFVLAPPHAASNLSPPSSFAQATTVTPVDRWPCVSARISRIFGKLDLKSVSPFTWSVEDLTVICSVYILSGRAVNGVVMFELLCVACAYGWAMLSMKCGF